MKLPGYFFFVALWLAGCQSSSPASSIKPEWLISPERAGTISMVGYAPRQADNNESAQYKVAVMKARQELAQMVRVRVQSQSELAVTDNNGTVSATANQATRLTSKAALRLNDARVTRQWTDPADGGLYLLLEIPE